MAALATVIVWTPPSAGEPRQARLITRLSDLSGMSSTDGDSSDDGVRGIEGLAYESQQSPQRISSQARKVLMGGDPAQAVILLRRALGQSPQNPELLNDLAAARIEHAVRHERPVELPLALSAVEKALELDDALLPARYNRALALELLYLRGAARDAWDDYVRLDPTSHWTGEAQRRRSRIASFAVPVPWQALRPRVLAAAANHQTMQSEIAMHAPQVREYLEDEALTAWAQAWLDDDADRADAELETARRLAEALFVTSGERLPIDAVAAIDQSAEDVQRRTQLAQAQLHYREGLGALRAFECARAQEPLHAALAAFRGAGSPMHLRVVHRLAVCDFHARRWQSMVEALESVRTPARLLNYLDLCGRIDWLEGLWQFKRFDPSLALAHYRAAHEVFVQAGDQSSAYFIRCLMAEALNALGDRSAEWQERLLVLEGLDKMVVARRAVALQEFAESSFENGWPRVALHFLNRALQLAQQELDTEHAVEMLKSRALILAALDRPGGAEADLDLAESALRDVADEQFRHNLQRDLRAARGIVLRDQKPSRAIDILTTALNTYRAENTQFPLQHLLLQRGRARLRLDDVPGAATDFRSALEIADQHLELIGTTAHRISFFDRARAATDELVALELRRERYSQAFDAAEHGNARQLLETVSGASAAASEASAAPLAIDMIRRSLPDGAALLMYAVLPDRSVSWCVRPTGLTVEQSAIGSEQLAAEVGGFVGELEQVARSTPREDTQAPRLRRRAAELFDHLIRPQLKNLKGARRLCVVPDKALHQLPFSALFNDSTGRWLVQDFELSTGLSATLAVGGFSGSSHQASATPPTALLIGDPQISPFETRLVSLPGARREAVAVAQYYPRHRLLTGGEATKKRFIELAGRYRVVHFGGHALTNSDSPEYSRLVLAPDTKGTSGSLFAHELQHLVLDETRVVVLAACSTASGSLSEGEGPLSLARAFLRGGVPGVVATLWPVRDDASVELFRSLHERLARGVRPSAALRGAQLQLLVHTVGESRSPAVWAAVQVFDPLR